MKRSLATVIVAGMALVLCGCTDGQNASRVLADQGYSDIIITGYRAFACGDDYTYQTGFSANSSVISQDQNGKVVVVKHRVSGTVCAGWLKGNSIKLD